MATLLLFCWALPPVCCCKTARTGQPSQQWPCPAGLARGPHRRHPDLCPRRPVDGQLWLLGSVHLDMLAALMLLVISTVGVAVALYSFAYIREYQGKGMWPSVR